MSRTVGAAMEARAADYLRARGLMILEQNFTCKGGELDLVCQDGDTLVFVEVRGRAHDELGDPLETIGPEKRRRVIHAARVYLVNRHIDEVPCRFDIVTLVGDAVTHYEDAFSTTD